MKKLEKKIHYFLNGNLSREYHVNEKGQRHGLYKDWWDNGKIVFMQQYKKDEEHGIEIRFGYK